MNHVFKIRSLGTKLIPFIAVATLIAAPALAGGHHGRHHGHGHGHGHGHARHHGHGHHGHDAYHHHYSYARAYYGPPVRRFVVPAHIGHAYVESYRPYFHGAVYFGPHRHYHDVYYFPVHTADGWVSEPHAYCGDDLYRAHFAYSGPNVAVSLHF